MLPFRKVDRDNVFELDEQLKTGRKWSWLSLPTLITWGISEDFAWTTIEDEFIIRFVFPDDGTTCYVYPIRGELKKEIVERLLDEANENGHSLQLALDPEDIPFLEKYFSQQFVLQTMEERYEYVYSRDDLAALAGKRYQSKRNHIKNFETKYNYQFVLLSDSIVPQCKELLTQWAEEKWAWEVEKYEFAWVDEYYLDNYKKLGMSGGAIQVNGKIVAFCAGFPVNDEMFTICLEKAGREYTGSYAVINRDFVRSLPANFKYINREDDMNDDGLRQAKMSYHPIFFRRKVKASYVEHEKANIAQTKSEFISLSAKSFGEDEAYVESFINSFLQEGKIDLLRKNRYVVAGAFRIQFDFDYHGTLFPAGYLCYISTVVQERGKGYFKRIMQRSLGRLYDCGRLVAFLTASDQSLKESYMRNFDFAAIFGWKNLFHEPYDVDQSLNLSVARIVNARKILNLYAQKNPEKNLVFRLIDPIIPENNRVFELSNGVCNTVETRYAASLQHKTMTIRELTNLLFKDVRL